MSDLSPGTNTNMSSAVVSVPRYGSEHHNAYHVQTIKCEACVNGSIDDFFGNQQVCPICHGTQKITICVNNNQKKLDKKKLKYNQIRAKL